MISNLNPYHATKRRRTYRFYLQLPLKKMLTVSQCLVSYDECFPNTTGRSIVVNHSNDTIIPAVPAPYMLLIRKISNDFKMYLLNTGCTG